MMSIRDDESTGGDVIPAVWPREAPALGGVGTGSTGAAGAR